MSNEPTIDQVDINKAICKFMGGYKHHGDVWYYVGTDGFEHESGSHLKYHSSWDWLMPVWFKIQTIGADMGYVFKKFYEAFHAGIDHQSIGKCHHAIYEFIQWLNKKSSTTNDTTEGND